MPSFHFHLRKERPDKLDKCPIVLVYDDGETQTPFSTGRKINKKYWNQKSTTQMWVMPDYGDAHMSFNIVLRKVISDAEIKLNKFFNDNDRYPTREEMKELMGVDEKKADKTFFVLFREFIKFQSKKVTAGTVANYNKVHDRLKLYEAYCKTSFDFTSLNHGFYNHFTEYLIKEHHSQNNTVGSYIKIIKTVLHWCETHHGISIDKSVMANMHVIKEQNFFAWLNSEEQDILWKLDLGDNKPLLSRSRDAFLFQCQVGCRYGDMLHLIEDNIKMEGGKHILRIKTRKNQKLIQVPLTERAVAILEKYKGIPPSQWIPSMVDCNYYIKEVCKLAGFYEHIQIVRGKGDDRKPIIFPKYKLITTHSARRSFINNLLSMGISDHVIAAMTGQSINTIQGYKHADTRDIMKAIAVLDRPKDGDSPMPKQPEGV